MVNGLRNQAKGSIVQDATRKTPNQTGLEGLQPFLNSTDKLFSYPVLP
jgi:hypothetical protein